MSTDILFGDVPREKLQDCIMFLEDVLNRVMQTIADNKDPEIANKKVLDIVEDGLSTSSGIVMGESSDAYTWKSP